ncbi:MAG: hypothetical protein CVU09_13445 [Bacteroidetes bacterium HGW-Bacteroidetes-4]|nr:MAG: hypothetical protein CVU09_13445 [Bacteroidetes bacterium HGW-Bacteroidetes-4]
MNLTVKNTVVGLFLLLSLYTRAQSGSFAGMGNASVMLYDFWSVFSNQAGLANLENPTLGFDYSNHFWLSETGTHSGAFVLPTRSGNFSLAFKRYGYVLYSENNLGLAYARKLGEVISASLQFDYLFFHQSENYGNRGAFLFETGIIAQINPDFSVGLHLYNPTRVKLADYADERVPTVMRFGLAYSFSPWVLFSIETEKSVEQKARFKCGLQYEPIKFLYLRTGLMTQPNSFTAGMGYRIKNFTTDLAFVSHENLPLSSQIALTYKF